ncbi:tripartite tricarboxylate transporter substrate binding protein [Cupriavidus sp. CP313]
MKLADLNNSRPRAAELSDHGRMRRACVVCVAGLTIAPRGFAANKYPSGPVQLVVPFTAGSGSDLVARVFGEGLASAMGQPVVINNRPGAGGTIAAGTVAKAEPDGQTLAVVGMGHLANPALYKSLPYDTLKDFAPISPLATFPNILIVPANGKIKTAQQLIALAKANPGQLSYGSGGRGSAVHINMQMLIEAAGIEMVHIPLKGAGEIVTEIAAGRCQVGWAPLGAALQMIRVGKVTALAISAKTRSKLLPDVPTIGEAGYPAAECNVWVGLLAPAKTRTDVVNLLSEQVRKVATDPAVTEKLAMVGAEPMTMTPVQFEALMRKDYVTLDRVMRKAS